MLERTRAQSPFYNADHEAFRDVMRRFVAREIEPYAHEWDEAGEFRASCTRRLPRSASWGSVFRKSSVVCRPTSS